MKANQWTKIRSQNPLPKSGKFSIKFKILTPGTLSFGLAIEPHKYGRFIHDEQ